MDGFDIVAVTETKLLSNPRHVLTNHALHTVAADRQHKAGQGLLLGVRKSLNFGVRPWFPSCGHSGTAWLRDLQPGSTGVSTAGKPGSYTKIEGFSHTKQQPLSRFVLPVSCNCVKCVVGENMPRH